MTDIHPRDFWAGQFGDEYIDRNTSDQLFASNLHFLKASHINLFLPSLRVFF